VTARSPARETTSDWLLPLTLIAAVTAWRLLIAAMVPVTQDEAYYFDWARSLAFGYFDHPPGVALLGIGTWLAPGSALAARLGAVAAGALTLVVLWRFYLACGLRRDSGLLLSLVLAAATLPGLIAGVITTPDTVLALCWALALHEGLAALQGRRQRWVTAGAAVGLGLLGKYTMVVIGPVFLWAIIATDPRALRTRWPYLGALAALLVFMPNILWNAYNDWLTMRFQFGHGFSTETGPLTLAADALPSAVGPMAYVKDASEPMALSQRLESVLSYFGTQLAFWGALLVPLLIALKRGSGAGGRLARARAALRARIDARARSLLAAGTLFPLLFFGAVATVSQVEPNWSALYLATAAPLAAVALQPLRRWALIAAGINAGLLTLYAVHAATAALPLPNAAERIMRETQGYRELAAYVATLDAPIFADRYPYAAMLNFHQPDLSVAQWPGITRPSEYGRGHLAPIPGLEQLRQSGFWLVAHKFSPPEIPGFRESRTQTAIACRAKPLQIFEGAVGTTAGGCEKPFLILSIYRYRAAADGNRPDSTDTARPRADHQAPWARTAAGEPPDRGSTPAPRIDG
jgi:4-amino-4-deoxy-L-arabinose transferase-like glycosyltransferase